MKIKIQTLVAGKKDTIFQVEAQSEDKIITGWVSTRNFVLNLKTFLQGFLNEFADKKIIGSVNFDLTASEVSGKKGMIRITQLIEDPITNALYEHTFEAFRVKKPLIPKHIEAILHKFVSFVNNRPEILCEFSEVEFETEEVYENETENSASDSTADLTGLE